MKQGKRYNKQKAKGVRQLELAIKLMKLQISRFDDNVSDEIRKNIERAKQQVSIYESQLKSIKG